jgi:hypothetical protein
VEILTDIDQGQAQSGVKRQRLTDRAKGDYLTFVDDDDWISESYVAYLVQACRKAPDVVTFDCVMTIDGRQERKFRFGFVSDDIHKGRMFANHLCAWRAEIARLVPWCPNLGYGDDQLWYKPLIAAGVWNECYVPRVLYDYRFSRNVTANQTTQRIEESRRYFGSGLRCFVRGDGQIYIEVGGRGREEHHVSVRNSRNEVSRFEVGELMELRTVKLV